MKTSLRDKIISIFLAVSLMAPLASCASKNKEYEVIKADDPWYECESFMVSDLYSKKDYEYISFNTIGTYDEFIFVSVDASKKIPKEERNLKDTDYLKYYEQSILKLSLQGELIEKTDYVNFTPEGYYRFLVNAWVSDGKLNTLEITLDTENGKYVDYYLNGELFTLPPVYNRYDEPLRLTNMYTTGGYTICIINPKYGQIISVESPDGSFYETYPSDVFNRYVDLYGILQGSEDNIILFGYDDYEMVYASLNLKTGETTELTGLLGSFDTQIDTASGKSISRDLTGFNFVNEQTGDLTKICEYSDINMPLDELIESQLLFISDSGDEIILAHEIYNSLGSFDYELVHLTKCDTNPNAGKTVLTLSNDDGAEPSNSDFYAMKLFNEQNASFFIKYVIPYDASGEYIDTEADILILSNPKADPSDSIKYVDLAPYLDINSEAFKEEFFTNAIDASMTGNSLYRVPLDISVSGIITASVNVPEGQVGFTYEQYLVFVDDICNGTDPLYNTPGYKMGKAECFTKLFLTMSDLYIRDGKVDLNNDNFRELISFVDEYGVDNEVPDETGHNSMVSDVVSSIEEHNANLEGKLGAVYGTFYSFDRYIDCYEDYGEGLGIYGLPSPDGRGPQTVSTEFVSVMADSKYPEACAEFVKYIMSYEAQCKTNYANPINRKALMTITESELNYYNESVTDDGLPNTNPLSKETIAKYIDLMSSPYMGMNAGGNIEIILREESASYFSGSKSLDDVIPVMEKRIQTVIDENK